MVSYVPCYDGLNGAIANHSTLRDHFIRIGIVQEASCQHCGLLETKTIDHVLIRCHTFLSERETLLNILNHKGYISHPENRYNTFLNYSKLVKHINFIVCLRFDKRLYLNYNLGMLSET